MRPEGDANPPGWRDADLAEHGQPCLRQAVIFRYALAWVIIAIGALLFGPDLLGFPGNAQSGGAINANDGYLAGVLNRSFHNTYQLCLLGAWAAIIPHAATLAVFHRKSNLVAGYGEFAVWAQTVLTSLGFLGTIIGVSFAVGGLETAMKADDPSQLIAGLATAFDTTFLGLGGALTLMLLRKIIDFRDT